MNSTYPNSSSDFDGQNFTSLILLQKRGTHAAYQSAIEGSSDIIFVTQPSKSQIQYTNDLVIELAYIPIGYEAFVFIVNFKNPVNHLLLNKYRVYILANILIGKTLGDYIQKLSLFNVLSMNL